MFNKINKYGCHKKEKHKNVYKLVISSVVFVEDYGNLVFYLQKISNPLINQFDPQNYNKVIVIKFV